MTHREISPYLRLESSQAEGGERVLKELEVEKLFGRDAQSGETVVRQAGCLQGWAGSLALLWSGSACQAGLQAGS